MTERVNLWMTSLLTWTQKLRDREEGQAAVEYGVLLALILAVAIVFIGPVGDGVRDAFSTISAKL